MNFKYLYRTADGQVNPTLPDGVYGQFITLGIPVGFGFNGSQTVCIIFLCGGGDYGIDSLSEVLYKGADITGADWILHRGTYTKQIRPVAIQSVNASTNKFNSTSHGKSNDTVVRFGIINGDFPKGIDKDTKYYVIGSATNEFQVSLTLGGSAVDFTDIGSGDLIFWEANTGFDDPEQGLPTFAPEANSTFNNIAYIELKIPSGLSTVDVEPDWEDFRFVGVGRRIMNFDSLGNELGVIDTDIDMLTNGGLVIADNLLTNFKIKRERIDWTSLSQLKASASVFIWQRAKAGSSDVVADGLVGRYYSDGYWTNLVQTQNDGTIDFNFTGIAPVAGQPTTNYSIKWNGQIVPDYTEQYTFTFIVDDLVIFYINGQEIINNNGLGVGTFTATYNMIAGQAYDIEVLYKNVTGDAYIHFKWQSASQALEIVPASAIKSQDVAVRRYPIHSAFPSPTEASEVHERFMERCAGWDWTDDNGLIKFLSPDREKTFTFVFDKQDDDSQANFVKGSFSKKRRPISERKNYLLGRFRNVLQTGYPISYADADREDLRELTNGQPDNDAPIDVGVSNRSQTERMLEDNMIFNSDPKHTFSIASGRKSSGIKKNHIGTISYIDRNGEYIAEETVIATFVSVGDKSSKRDFNLLPIPDKFYTDEPVSGDIPDVDVTPTDLTAEEI